MEYFKGKTIFTRLNLMEFYYYVLKEFGKSQADLEYSRLATHTIDFDDDTLKEAMQFRLEMRKNGKDLSYVDAIGYIVAKKSKVEFLTGDDEFKGLPNVKFVK